VKGAAEDGEQLPLGGVEVPEVGDTGGVVVTLVGEDVVARLGGAESIVQGRLLVDRGGLLRPTIVPGEELRRGSVLVEDMQEVAIDGGDDLPPIPEMEADPERRLGDLWHQGIQPVRRAMGAVNLVRRRVSGDAVDVGIGRRGSVRVLIVMIGSGAGGEEHGDVNARLATS
jgi:hypothetical protein